jgi:acetyltransferase
MSVRNLDALLKPRAVALVGASRRAGSVGRVLAANLFNSGFDGPVMPVTPTHRSVEGVLAYRSLAELPETPDLCVIATPPDTVPGLVSEAAARGARAAVVITAGFSGDQRGRELQQAMLEAAQPHLLRIVGPNCLGIMVPGAGLNASFAHLHPRRGGIAFIAQSGAVLTSVLDWADARGIGFSHLLSVGDMSDVDFGDLLDYLAIDAETRAILLYIEAVTHARKFLSAARAASRIKPVIVIKAGRRAEGAQAAASHTGALAGSDAAYEAAFRRAGMLRVANLDELFDAVETLALARPVQGNRLAILSNGGGIGVLATDALVAAGGKLAELAPATIEALDRVLPRIWSKANPIDIIGDADGGRYAKSLEILLGDKGADAVLILNCPTAIASSTEAAQAVIETLRGADRCVLTSWLGEATAREARRRFSAARIPSYDTPGAAVRAFMHMVDYRHNQEMLTQTPPSIPRRFSPDIDRVRGIVTAALSTEREWLTEPEAKDVLDAYGIPVVPTHIAETPQAAAALAAQTFGPVALKIHSPDITHKSDVGGVALDLETPGAVAEAATRMLARVRETKPGARIEGFTVQPMVRRPGAHELIVGVSEDRQFGPLILFGQGGTAVEVLEDTALALPPLNMHLAREVMERTRVHQLLKGYRGRPGVAFEALALTLVKVSQLVIDIDELAELDINPLLADEYGVVALDARVRVRPAPPGPPAQRLAIRPYPKRLERLFVLPDGRELILRPVRPEDEPQFQELFSHLSPDDIRMRFFAPKKALTHPMAARLTQIDYDREMALVVAQRGLAGQAEVYGAVHLAADPDNERAEFAILVRSDMVGLGLGPLLMQRAIEYARERGIGQIFGDVLRDNHPMLRLCDLLGFRRRPDPEDPGVLHVWLDLADAESP